MAIITAEAIKKSREKIDERRERLKQELNKLREQESRVNRRAAKAVQERIELLGVNIDDLALISGSVALVMEEGREEEARAFAAQKFATDVAEMSDSDLEGAYGS